MSIPTFSGTATLALFDATLQSHSVHLPPETDQAEGAL